MLMSNQELADKKARIQKLRELYNEVRTMVFRPMHYYDNGRYCFLGYLAHKCGISDETLKNAGSVRIIADKEEVVLIRNKIRNAYDMPTGLLIVLQDANDLYFKAPSTRSHPATILLEYIQFLEEELAQERQ